MRSILGYKIEKKKINENVFEYLNNKKLSLLVKNLIASRINKIENLELFLNPLMKVGFKEIPAFQNLEIGVKRIENTIKNKEKICIFGDYDVDGSCASAMLKIFFQKYKINVDVYIPDRIKEGYGFSEIALRNLGIKKYNLIICVDCGTNSKKEIQICKENNVDVLILDHHQSIEKNDNAIIINPNQDGDKSNLYYLSAGGIVLFFLIHFLKQQENKVDIVELIPLAGLSTVCDVMPLTELNRIIVDASLKIINKKKNLLLGLEALINITGIESNLSASDFGFKIGPIINAGGRIGKSSLGMEILTSNNQDFINKNVKTLYELNQERIFLEKKILEEINEIDLEIKKQINKFGFIFQYNENWHEGLIGIIASRVKDKYHYPTFIGNLRNNVIKCSARSIQDIDIGMAILNAVEKKLLIKGGGHESAGGLSIEIDKINDFLLYLKENYYEKTTVANLNKTLYYDTEITLKAINQSLFSNIKILEPFGVKNQKPIFLIKNLTIIKLDIINEKHIKFFLIDNFNGKISCMFFNKIDLLKEFKKGNIISIITNIEQNLYEGNYYINGIILDIII